MMVPVPLWTVGDYGSGLLGTVVALVTGGGSAVMVLTGSERGLLWAAVIPVSMGLAVPAPFIAESLAMRRLVALLEQIMRSDATVLIEGETGSGKELVARAIHAGSPRRAGPFVAVNCAAIPDSLAESELFGHERGAFTGALQAQPGWFEQAHGGTILLDEVGETPLSVQAKLLRVLQEREVRRVGSRRAIRVDIRILAATNEGLAGLVQTRRFRQDLYHRLHVVTLAVPPLRDRLADLAPLAQHFLAVHAGRAQKTLALGAPALTRMREHPWPGNVRELEHAIQRAVVLARGPEIMPDDLGLDDPSGWSRPATAPQHPTERRRHPAPRRPSATGFSPSSNVAKAIAARRLRLWALTARPSGVNCGDTRRSPRAPSAHRETKAMSIRARQPRSRGGLTRQGRRRHGDETARDHTMTTTAHPHIRLDDRGIAWIDDANVKVIEVVLDRLAYGWSPEEIHLQHGDLSLAQIHSALAYYYDHQSRLDAEIASQEQTVRRLRSEAGESSLLTRLKARGLIV